MSAKESFQTIIDAIPDVENFDTEIGEVTDALVKSENVDGGVFEEKYNKLLEKYKARFGEMLSESTAAIITKDEPAVTDEVEITDLSELDFDGSTE